MKRRAERRSVLLCAAVCSLLVFSCVSTAKEPSGPPRHTPGSESSTGGENRRRPESTAENRTAKNAPASAGAPQKQSPLQAGSAVSQPDLPSVQQDTHPGADVDPSWQLPRPLETALILPQELLPAPELPGEVQQTGTPSSADHGSEEQDAAEASKPAKAAEAGAEPQPAEDPGGSTEDGTQESEQNRVPGGREERAAAESADRKAAEEEQAAVAAAQSRPEAADQAGERAKDGGAAKARRGSESGAQAGEKPRGVPAPKEPEKQRKAEGQEEPAEADRKVWAVPGEQIDLAFVEYGWVYHQNRGDEAGIVEFSRRSYEKGQTRFLFNARRKGTRLLRFSRGDAERGNRYEKLVRVNVVSEEERQARMAAAGEALAQPRESPAERSVSGAAEAEKEEAFPQEQELLTAARQGEPQTLENSKSLMESGRERLAAKLLQAYLEQLPEDDYRRGDVLYFLGKLYEAPGPLRDERRAVEFYDRAVRGYPGSSYWHRAQERSRYLKRNYIHIR